MKDGVTKYPEDFLRESNCVMCSLTVFHFNLPITVSLTSSHVKRLELKRMIFLFHNYFIDMNIIFENLSLNVNFYCFPE